MKVSGLVFHSLTIRNFLSFGNTDTTLNLDERQLVNILGENRDTGGEDSRNGAGKSAIMDAFCYAINGNTRRELTKSDIINKKIRKGLPCYVHLEFSKDKYRYRIERQEAPSSTLRFYRKSIDSNDDWRKKEDNKLLYDITKSKDETKV